MALATRPKASTHRRKAAGKHHRHSRVYLKSYWPYLPLIAIVSLGIALNSLLPKPGGVLGTTADASLSSLLADTNAQRSTAGDGVLSLNNQLTAAAQAKANDMVARNYWSHNTPDGQTPWTFLSRVGYNYQKAGENLAYGFASASSTITGWMNSPEHRANLLSKDYTEVGFGIANAPNYQGKGAETVIVAMYGRPAISGVNITFNVANTNPQVAAINTQVQEPQTLAVSRVQQLTKGAAPWSLFAVATLTAGAVMIFLFRHGLAWRRLLLRSEAFVVHHPMLDITVVSVAVIGYLLSQSVGLIR